MSLPRNLSSRPKLQPSLSRSTSICCFPEQLFLVSPPFGESHIPKLQIHSPRIAARAKTLRAARNRQCSVTTALETELLFDARVHCSQSVYTPRRESSLGEEDKLSLRQPGFPPRCLKPPITKKRSLETPRNLDARRTSTSRFWRTTLRFKQDKTAVERPATSAVLAPYLNFKSFLFLR